MAQGFGFSLMRNVCKMELASKVQFSRCNIRDSFCKMLLENTRFMMEFWRCNKQNAICGIMQRVKGDECLMIWGAHETFILKLANYESWDLNQTNIRIFWYTLFCPLPLEFLCVEMCPIAVQWNAYYKGHPDWVTQNAQNNCKKLQDTVICGSVHMHTDCFVWHMYVLLDCVLKSSCCTEACHTSKWGRILLVYYW